MKQFLVIFLIVAMLLPTDTASASSPTCEIKYIELENNVFVFDIIAADHEGPIFVDWGDNTSSAVYEGQYNVQYFYPGDVRVMAIVSNNNGFYRCNAWIKVIPSDPLNYGAGYDPETENAPVQERGITIEGDYNVIVIDGDYSSSKSVTNTATKEKDSGPGEPPMTFWGFLAKLLLFIEKLIFRS